MSTALPYALPTGILEQHRTPAGARRLWRGLAAGHAREMPTHGADTLGERVVGWVHRLRARRLDRPRAERILARAAALRDLSEPALADAVALARERIMLSRDDTDAVSEAFALAHEAVRRETSLSLHPEQILGALAMARGCCAELATGEGKTLTAILPATIDAWSGRGVHVITVNDYLARRDAQTTRPVYKRLGVSVGLLQEGSTPHERRQAYLAGVTYAADKQVIFDHLRDRLLTPLSPRLVGLLLEESFPSNAPRDGRDPEWGTKVVQRELYSAIVDEADSVLIDDAVTPAIISGASPAGLDGSHHLAACRIAADLTPGTDYLVEKRLRHATFTDAGRAKLAARAHALPAFWAGPRRREELVQRAVLAREMYTPGEDYIVHDGAVKIIDRSTGRVLPGRQWQLGMHQAVEAKEGLTLTKEQSTTSRSSYQQFFRRYRRLAGMTGTAREVADELWRWYRLPVAPVPTHKPVIRTQARDVLYTSQDAKYAAVAERVAALRARGRPVLVGTRSVNASERLAAALRERGIECDVLNATKETEEAAIIARAGREGAVTVATNMAGRGTDIILTPEARKAGGLAVIATERNDERRVDRQLFGRAGRQGDPGSAEVHAALDDDLFVRHAPRVLRALARGGMLTSLLTRTAQFLASRHWVTMRAEAARAEAYYAMAMHDLTR